VQKLVLGQWEAHAFRNCDMEKGASFVEPMCFSDGRRMFNASANVISKARDDVLFGSYSDRPLVNPYPSGTAAAAFYASVALDALGEGENPYVKR
jgi:hypothetical protein